MAQKNPRLTRRTVVMIKMESTPGVDAGPVAALDAVLVGAPDYMVNPQMLKRDYVRDDLSPIGDRIGRKLAGMKFEVELRGNGFSQSGNIGDAPLIGRLLRACGYAEVAVNTAATPGAVRQIGQHQTVASWSVSGSNTTRQFYDYMVTCVASGATGVAKLRVSELNGFEPSLLKNETFTASAASAAGTVAVDASNPLSVLYTIAGTWVGGDRVLFNVGGYTGAYTVQTGANDITSIATGVAAAITALNPDYHGVGSTNVVTVTFTSAQIGTTASSGATSISLGASGAAIVPTWSGSLALGQTWKVSVSPTGVKYVPVSIGQETATIYMYMDGNLHKITAAMGTFQFAANAGEYGKMTFEFTGQYNAPLNANLPSAVVYDTPLPPTFQLAQLRVNSVDVTINALSFAQTNTIVPRDDANSTDGYIGVRITAREPQAGVDPEMTLVGDYDPWSVMAESTYMPFSVVFGQKPGNVVWMKAPRAQYNKLSYKDRNGIRVYDAGLVFARELGNDEVTFFFA
jgi:hypothetical protein